ncbi:hypothetical protein C8R45DRAFT_928468 [Mycena sanguinolenta]|nr:hypothetical protein C8R45DRAFT_928468 [Mycena sanguinolenta]
MERSGMSPYSGLIISAARFYDAASICCEWKSTSSSALQFAHRAQDVAKESGNMKQQYIVLLRIAHLKVNDGNHPAGYKLASEAQQLSDLLMDLYHSAIALYLQARCSGWLGNYHKSLEQLYRARENLAICGMSRGVLDNQISLSQAEIYLIKSEYVQAQIIYSDMAETTSPDQNSQSYGSAFLNLAYIGTQIGYSAANISKELDIARAIFKGRHHPGHEQCRIVEASLNLRDHTFDLGQREFQEWSHSSSAEIRSVCLAQLANTKACAGLKIARKMPKTWRYHYCSCPLEDNSP